MNERERTALAEAIEHCALHNLEYQHVTPAGKIAEWQSVLGEATEAERPTVEQVIEAAQIGAIEAGLARDALGPALGFVAAMEILEVVADVLHLPPAEWQSHLRDLSATYSQDQIGEALVFAVGRVGRLW